MISEWRTHTLAPTPGLLYNRTLPGNEDGGSTGSISSFNLIFIVGLALIITVLARYLSTRGRKK